MIERPLADLNRQLTQALQEHGEREAAAIADLYLAEQFGASRTDILLNKSVTLSAEGEQTFSDHLRRLSEGEPVQYVLGRANFLGRTFHVSPAVLIPRPETEGILPLADNLLGDTPAPHILDAGTGSGCIAISLALQHTKGSVTAWDISDEAIAVASQNAQALSAKVRFLHRDILAEAETPTDSAASLDLLVSNPPYIREREKAEMETHVLDHEPHLALFVPDYAPLRFYRALGQLGLHLLKPGGHLLVETHSDYATHTAQLFEVLGYSAVRVHHDCFDLPRFVEARRDQLPIFLWETSYFQT